MTVSELIVLLPCHSLEDFPQYHEGDEAAELLTSWTALWRPELIAAAGKMPRWSRADFPPDNAPGNVYLIPPLSDRLIAVGWKGRAQEEGAVVVAAQADCRATAAELLARTEISPVVADELADDFFAFGYCYLQMELLTRQMRYVSSLDEPHIETQLLAAAQAAVTGDAVAARERLSKCFDVLMEARDRFYPVDVYLLDLALVAESFWGEPLRRDLSSPLPLNVHLNGEQVERLTEREPETLAALRAALESRSVGVVGGEYNEAPLPLRSLDAIERDFDQAQASYLQHLGAKPKVYLRRTFGLSPFLPLLLSRRQISGCIHCTFDDGLFPPIGQSKTRWQSLDGSAIEAFGRVPLDARLPQSFLALSQKISESMDLDHVAAVAFVRWPGETNFWFSLLKRAQTFGHALGKFATFDQFFEQSDYAGRLDKFDADDYRSAYLKQAVARDEADPISRHLRSAQSETRSRVQRSISAWAQLISGDPHSSADASSDSRTARLATVVAHEVGASSVGQIVFNPFAHELRRSASMSDSEAISGVNIPAFGFAWIPSGAREEPPPSRKGAPPLAAEHILANEHLEVKLDPTTGGIRSLRDFKHRGNRLSQQLALRLPGAQIAVGQPWRDPDESAHYSVMVADEIQTTSTGPSFGEIAVAGRLVDREGRLQARFRQRLRLARDARVVTVDIHLDPEIELPADPWGAYFACRFAWSDELAELRRSVHGTSQPTKIKRFEAPRFIEINDDPVRTAILTGGLPYHRRVGERMLDSLLIVRGDTGRDFRLGLGLDVPNLAGRAEELLLDQLPSVTASGPRGAASGWFFHLDAPNVVALDWSPLVEAGQVVGFCAKLLETAGRPGRVKLRVFRPIARAMQVDALGNPIVTLSASDDTILVDFSVFELVEVEARWTLPATAAAT